MHIGFIMDGNRRWANQSGFLKKMGHKYGGDQIEPILKLCLREKIEAVSFWALATENLKNRDSEEIEYIYQLIETQVPRLAPKLIEKNIRFRILGDITLLPENIRNILLDAEEKTAGCTALIFALGMPYGGQHEIIQAVKKIGEETKTLPAEERERFFANLDENTFRGFLQSSFLPDIDLIVRTGGYVRHSGYLLYLSEYAEYYFTPVLWPDFGEADFYKALSFYQHATRNF